MPGSSRKSNTRFLAERRAAMSDDRRTDRSISPRLPDRRQFENRLLRPVRRRIQWRRAIQMAIWTWLIAACGSLLLASLRYLGVPISRTLAVAPLAVGPVLGWIIGSMQSVSFYQTARLVDEHCRLKDACLTAWQFLGEPQLHPVQRLQVVRTIELLSGIPIKQRIAPAPWQAWRYAVAVTLLAFVVLALPAASSTIAASTQAEISNVAQQIAKELEAELVDPVNELARLFPPASLQREQLALLAEQLQTSLEQMKGSQTPSRKELLATLSDMQRIAEQSLSELDPRQAAEALQRIGKALEESPSLQKVAEALEQRQFETAATQLEKLDPEQVDREDAHRVAEQLQDTSEQLQRDGQPAVAKSAEQLAKGLVDQDAEQATAAARQLAKHSRDTAAREQVAAQLARQMALLSDAKGLARSGGKSDRQSDRDKQTFGRGTTGTPFGDDVEQALQTQRRQEALQGDASEGPSDKQRVRSTESSEQAERPMRQPTASQQRADEAAVLQEDLPLGQRQIIRNYFRAIRPAK